MSKCLDCERLYLRDFSPEDEAELLALDADPEVMAYLSNGRPSSRESIKEMMQKVSSQVVASRGKYGVWAAIEKETGRFVGWFHLFPPKDSPEDIQRLYLGYRIRKEFWGFGYATEVSRALIEKAFSELGASEVCAQAMKANRRSVRVMEKIGMSFCREFQENSFPIGFQDAVLYSIKR